MRRRSTVVLSLLFALGCGDTAATGASGQGGGDGGQAAGGAPAEGGQGGEGGCAAGSHDDGTGVCVAELGSFEQGPEMASARDHHMTWAAKRPGGSFLYVAGGYADQVTPVYTIERATIQADGGLGAWETLPTPTNMSGACLAVTDDVVVLAGGFRGSSPSKAVDIMTIADDGSLSDPADGPYLADARFHGAGALVDGWFYAVGGLDSSGTSLATVERARLDGASLGEWAPDSQMPEEVSHHGLATDGHFLFVTGGLKRVDNDFNNDVGYDTVLRSEIQPDGSLGSWETLDPLPVALSVHSSFVHANMLYVVGGLDNASLTFQKKIYRAPIASDGALGAWEELSVLLPKPRGHALQTPIVDGVLYSTGGENFGGSLTDVVYARFD